MNYNAIQLLKSCGLIAALSASAVAQGTAGPDIATQPETDSVMARSFSMHFVSGALRAGGPGYKARFDQDGMEYTPALGDAAPRNLPVHFRLKSIRRGQHVLFEAAAGNAVAPRQQGMVASYDRGNGVVETYEARVDGVKQNFTFQTVPMGSGDLVVECELQTELQSVRGTSDQGFSLEMPGVGGVTIGQVIGLDAFNSRVTGSMSCDGTTLQLVLPDRFVSQAAYPMVLDPIVGTTAAINTAPAKDPDVAFDETYDDYLVVWEHQFSQLDIDVRAQKLDLDGNLVATAILVTNVSGNEINPCVANVDGGSHYLVCWQDGPSVFGPWHLRARRVDGGTVTTQSTTLDVTPVGDGSRNPDISGENSTVSPGVDGCIIVYEDGSVGIRVVKVDVSSVTIVAGPNSVTSNPNSSNPAISKCGGVSGRHAIVYERDFGTDRDIRGQLVDRDLNVLDSFFSVESSASLDSLNPDVDGDGDSWAVVYQRNESLLTAPADIYCRRFAWNGTSVNATAGEVPVADTAGVDVRDPAIGYMADATGSKYLVAWCRQVVGLNYDVRMIALDAGDCSVCGQAEFGAGGAPTNIVDLNPEIATRWSGRASNTVVVGRDQAMAVWMDLDDDPPFEGDLVGNLYEAFVGGPVADLGGSCGNGGVNTAVGPCALGNTAFEVQLTGAGSSLNLLSIMFVDNTLPCTTCAIQSDPNSYLFAPGAGGNASFPLPIPCNPAFIGADLYMQWATLLSGSYSCLLLPPSLQHSYSNRIQATIAP